MAFSKALDDAGHAPQALDVSADVTFQPGEGITGIKLTVRGQVEGIDADQFQSLAEAAKDGCPVSQALKGTTITLDASLA
jgi:osmotically inducible protein OsmC